jgi:hypothetical protein
MISQQLVDLIEKNADKLAKEWLADVKKNALTPYYHTFDEDRLHERAFSMYKELSRFLEVKTPKEQITKYYRKYGQDRFQEGFPLSQLIYSFILFRRHLWLFILHSGFFDTAYELLRALELNNRVVLFFDRALVSMVQAYEECLKKQK